MRQLVDVRQRRGVRGSEYAWANATRLQAALAEAGIDYRHHKELAPTTELRRLQYREDARQGVGKRARTELAPEYVARYTRENPPPRRSHPDPRGGHAAGRSVGALLRRARSRGVPPLIDRGAFDRHRLPVIHLRP